MRGVWLRHLHSPATEESLWTLGFDESSTRPYRGSDRAGIIDLLRPFVPETEAPVDNNLGHALRNTDQSAGRRFKQAKLYKSNESGAKGGIFTCWQRKQIDQSHDPERGKQTEPGNFRQ